MPTPTLTLTLSPAASPPILYPVVNCSETLTARRSRADTTGTPSPTLTTPHFPSCPGMLSLLVMLVAGLAGAVLLLVAVPPGPTR